MSAAARLTLEELPKGRSANLAGALEVPGFRRTELGLYIPDRRTWYARPTCVDLFCGCGGFSLGMVAAGFQVVMGVDNEPAAAMTYLYNLVSYPLDMRFTSEKWRDSFERALQRTQKRAQKKADGDLVTSFPMSGGNPHKSPEWERWPVEHFYFGDVRELTGAMILEAIGLEVGELDCVVGGPPCQGFSTANSRRSPEDPRNSLVFEFVRLVLELRPRTMVMENVPAIVNMVTPEGIPVVDAICRVLEDGGFGAYESLRQSLLATAGLGAAVRHKRPDKKTRKQKGGGCCTEKHERPKKAAAQRELFA